jgi:hypothetical protein
MKHVEDFFKILEYKESKKVERTVFLATDDVSVQREASKK